MKLIYTFIFLFSIFSSGLYAKNIDVYLKVDDEKVYQAVKELNLHFQSHDLFKKYQFQTFFKKYPMHVTLYQADFKAQMLPELIKSVKEIASHWQAIQLRTDKLYLTAGNYLMLDILNDRANKSSHHSLQALSDKITLTLSPLHDEKAVIPAWAKAIPEKQRAFQIYGSPNVFSEYQPHISLFAFKAKNDDESQSFKRELAYLIKNYSIKNIVSTSNKIGIAFVNQQGQITEEIISFTLKSG
jgi:hypothetical protein